MSPYTGLLICSKTEMVSLSWHSTFSFQVDQVSLGMTTSPYAQVVPFLIAQQTGIAVLMAALCLIETVLALLYHLLSEGHTHNYLETAHEQA